MTIYQMDKMMDKLYGEHYSGVIYYSDFTYRLQGSVPFQIMILQLQCER